MKVSKIIDAIAVLCGEGTSVACVPKSGNLFEISLDGRAGINILLDGIEIDDKRFECRNVTQRFMLVSVMHLAAYIPDSDISEKLESQGGRIGLPHQATVLQRNSDC